MQLSSFLVCSQFSKLAMMGSWKHILKGRIQFSLKMQNVEFSIYKTCFLSENYEELSMFLSREMLKIWNLFKIKINLSAQSLSWTFANMKYTLICKMEINLLIQHFYCFKFGGNQDFVINSFKTSNSYSILNVNLSVCTFQTSLNPIYKQ